MSKKATHRGICQLCGNDQKLPGGRLSKHGYTVQWGFFSGICPGTRGLPIELSCDLVEKAEANARNQAAQILTSAAEVEADREQVWVVERVAARSYGRSSTSRWRQIKRGEMVELGYFTKWTGEDGKQKETNIYLASGSDRDDPDAYVIHLNTKRADFLKREAAEVTRYADWLVHRLQTWKPGEIRPIKD